MTVIINGNGLTTGIINFVPPGGIMYFPFQSAPSGWIVADGSLQQRVGVCAQLFAAAQSDGFVTDAAWFGGAWGRFSSGDLATTFRIPELRGEFIRGLDVARGIDPSRSLGVLQDGTSIRTVPTEWTGTDNNGGPYTFGNPFAQADNITNTAGTSNPRSASNGVPNALSNDNSMTATALNNAGTSADVWIKMRPRNIALLPCIKL